MPEKRKLLPHEKNPPIGSFESRAYGGEGHEGTQETNVEPQSLHDRVVSATEPLSQSETVDAINEDVQSIDLLLRQAGVSSEGVSVVTSNLNWIALTLKNPSMASMWAQRYPAGSRNTYGQAETLLGFSGITDAMGTSGFDIRVPESGYNTSAEGNRRYANGVIVDVITGQVYYPNAADVEGSPPWLMGVSEWGKAQRTKWTKTLERYGYTGMPTLQENLKMFFDNKYLWGNGDKPVKLDKAKTPPLFTKPELRNTVRATYRAVFGPSDDPSDDEIQPWVHLVRKEAKKLLDEGYSPEGAAQGAQEKFIEKFEANPEVRAFYEEEDRNKYNTTLANGLLSIQQLVSG